MNQKKIFGFIQGRMTRAPSKKILQYFPKKNWTNEFHLAKKYNFYFIEYFSERNYNRQNPIWNKNKLILIKKLVKKNNLISYSFCDDYFINHNLLKFKYINKYFNKISKNLSFLKIRIYVLALFEKSIIDKKNINNYSIKLKQISDILEKYNINLALETNLDYLSLIRLIKLTDKTNLGVVYDTGNRLKSKNYQYKEILKLNNFIKHFHLKDKNWKGENVVLGTGNVNFTSIIKAINKIKYKGKFSFETNRGDDPVTTMNNNKHFIIDKLTKFKK